MCTHGLSACNVFYFLITLDGIFLATLNSIDQNYAQSLTFYHLWLDIGQTYYQVSSDRISCIIWNNRRTSGQGKLIHPTSHLIIRFVSNTESGYLLTTHSSGLQSHPCARSLREFFASNLQITRQGSSSYNGAFCTDVNLIAHWANLGYLEEAVIRNHILQSLISHPKLHDHQAHQEHAQRLFLPLCLF